MTAHSTTAGMVADQTPARVALVGFGEVGQLLASGFASHNIRDVNAWDVLFPAPGSAPSRAAAAARQVRVTGSMREALTDRNLVISAVTAAQCLAAATAAAEHLPHACYYLDLNSVSPGTRLEAATVVERSGGRFVEGAMMSPIAPKGAASPILLGGPHCTDFVSRAAQVGFTNARPYAATVGSASAAKMCRSVIVKGMEALLTEALLCARRYRVEPTVLESLHDLLPLPDWPRQASYMLSRSLQHGRRRAEEMREVAKTIAEIGLEPWMSTACAKRQEWAAELGAVPQEQALPQFLDALLRRAALDPEDAA